jgi:uncharacterized protein YegL
MAEVQLGNQSEQGKAGNSPINLDKILKGNWPERLNTDNFEDAQSSLLELRALRQWRSDSQRYALTPFYKLLETAASVKGMSIPQSDQAALISDLVDRLMPVAQTLSPRLRDMYLAFIAELDGSPYTPQFEMTTEQLSKLKESGDLTTLLDPSIPWAIKQNRMETRVLGDLRGRRALDRRESEIQEEIPAPPASDEHKSTMDEIKYLEELKEGEIPDAHCIISPAYGGYWRTQSLDTWNAKKNMWGQTHYDYHSVNIPIINKVEGQHIILSDLTPNRWMRVSLSSDLDINGLLSKKDRSLQIQQDQNGDYLVLSNTSEPLTFALKKVDGKRIHGGEPKVQLMPCDLTDETMQKIKEINQKRKGNLAKARGLASYTMRHITYPKKSYFTTDIPSFDALYAGHPNGKIGGIDRIKIADCDTAADYGAGLCSQLDIPVRLVKGHMVKGKDKDGNARITSATGHGWLEVWDEVDSKWVRVDFTPPGDPNMEEKQEKGESVPGDYGEQEALGPTDEELAKLEAQLSELTERLSYTPSERELAEATGVDLKEARSIVKEIQKAEGTRLKNGELVTDVLSQLFSRIVETRKTSKPDYTGRLRKKEGGEEIEDIVAHVVGVKSGEQDPISRQISQEKIHQAATFGGFDIYLVGDKSGSMSQTVDGETKWKMQRQAQYLILSSLNRFSENLKRAETIMTDPLNVRTQAISFRNPNEIDVDKPLSSQFTPADKVALWKSLGNQGSRNGDIAALTQIYEQIKTEVTETEKQGKKDSRLRIIIVCSDGYPDDERMVHQLAEDLGKLNAVVVGVGLTETAAKVPIIFDTQFSRGDIARDINDLPAIVAKHVIMEAIRLFPDKSRESVESYIKSTLLKLKEI